MNFTDTDRVDYDIYWDYDFPIYDQLHEEVDDQVRLDLIEQVESQRQVNEQVFRQVVYQFNPIRYKIKQEIIK